MAMEGLKSMSIDSAEMSLKSRMSAYGFCCTTASSGQSSESRDQSGGLPPSGDDSSMDEWPLAELWRRRLRGSDGSRPRSIAPWRGE